MTRATRGGSASGKDCRASAPCGCLPRRHTTTLCMRATIHVRVMVVSIEDWRRRLGMFCQRLTYGTTTQNGNHVSVVGPPLSRFSSIQLGMIAPMWTNAMTSTSAMGSGSVKFRAKGSMKRRERWIGVVGLVTTGGRIAAGAEVGSIAPSLERLSSLWANGFVESVLPRRPVSLSFGIILSRFILADLATPLLEPRCRESKFGHQSIKL